MREAMKRLLRLTPLISFAALDEHALQSVVEEVFDAAAVGLSGQAPSSAGRHRAEEDPSRTTTYPPPPTSAGVVPISRLTIVDVAFPPAAPADTIKEPDFEGAAAAALQIARSSGRVTNTNLRELVAITSEEAREVLQILSETAPYPAAVSEEVRTTYPLRLRGMRVLQRDPPNSSPEWTNTRRRSLGLDSPTPRQNEQVGGGHPHCPSLGGVSPVCCHLSDPC